MALTFYDTLTHSKQPFEAIHPPRVGLYTCGPTVYDLVHIGNWRTFVFEDILRRTLATNGYQVTQVMNITDIDDKIIKRAAEENTDITTIAQKYTELFFADRAKLNLLPADHYTKATDHVADMIALIERLLKKELAYIKDGSVYFSIEKFPSYGELSGFKVSDLKAGARVDADEYDKNSPADFTLWKAAKEGEPSWDSPFGPGRPGWHIECSAMSMKYLGDTFDIHTGGVDLVFPHHENEIAQSKGATGQPLAHYWLEGEHLMVEGQKMAKSAGNFYTLTDLESKKINPLALRYLFLTAHYRTPLNFTWDSLAGAATALRKLQDYFLKLPADDQGEVDPTYQVQFQQNLADDLNTPAALATVWNLIKDDNVSTAAKFATLLDFDQVLGFGLNSLEAEVIPQQVVDLATERETARQAQDWAKADALRLQITTAGYEVLDTDSGPEIRKTA